MKSSLLLGREDLLNRAAEIQEGSVDDSNVGAFLEHLLCRGAHSALLDLLRELLDLALADGLGALVIPDEARNFLSVFDAVPSLGDQVHLDEHIARH
jgi:hypothetical protein